MNMPAGLYIALFLIALLFAVKVIYVVTMGLVLSKTGGALFCSTDGSKIDVILDALPVKENHTVIDLGCGDGRFLAAAAKRCGARGIGYEINLSAYVMARVRQMFLKGRVVIKRENFWDASLGEADIVFCYLFPDILERLSSKAENELKAGAFLVSCNFPVPGWKPRQILNSLQPSQQDPIFIYKASQEAGRD